VVLDKPAGEGELRRFLADWLPAAVVPAAVVTVDSVPLTPNGKVDHTAFPDPPARPAAAASATAGGSLLDVVGSVWRDVLGVAQVAPDDGFFDLGGSSLAMVRVHARLQERFGPDLSIVELFRHPSLGSLVDYLAHRGGST
jgi:acyl carrier protein